MAMKSLSRISRKVSKKRTAPVLPHLEVKPREDRSVELNPNEHMREILKDNVLCWFFKAFLNKQYCSEILSCWLEIEGFRYLESSVEVGNKATYIFQQYIAAESPRQVNVNESLRDKVQEELSRPKKSMFDEVQAEAFNLMVTDSYTKFIGSAFYAAYLENETIPTVPRSVSAELLDRYLVRCKLPSNYRTAEPEGKIEFTDLNPTPFKPAQARAPGFMMKTQSAMSLPTLLVSTTGQRSFTTDSIERGGGIGSARGRHRTQAAQKPPEEDSSDYSKRFIVFDFEAEEENELSLKENTVVTLLEESESGWARVEVGTKSGWVPSSWLDPLEFLPVEEEAVAAEVPPPKPPKSAGTSSKLARIPTDPGPTRSATSASKDTRETVLALPVRDDSLNRSATPALPRPNAGAPDPNARGRAMPRGRGALRARGIPPGGRGGRGMPRGRGPPRGQAPPPPRGKAPGTPTMGRPLPQPGRPSRGSLVNSAGPPPTSAPPAPPKS